MNIQETVSQLSKLGIHAEVSKTGHPEWMRVFMIDSQGITQGRISFHKGELYNAKFYVHGAHFTGNLNKDEYLPIKWWALEHYGMIPSDEQIKEAQRRSYEHGMIRYREVQAKREANPLPPKIDKHGIARDRRKKLKLPDPRKNLEFFLGEVLGFKIDWDTRKILERPE